MHYVFKQIWFLPAKSSFRLSNKIEESSAIIKFIVTNVHEAFKKHVALPAALASAYENGNKLN